MEEVLEVVDAQKRFGDTEALRGAEIRLRRGEWLGLLGPNGAGKTTLVRAIAGRVRLDRGDLVLLGRSLLDPRAATEARRSLGVVPQDVALYATLTAEENLQAWGRLHGVAPARLGERVDWALEWTGLDDRRREKVGGFSGGMKRRLNLACGVLHRPEVILLDEPTVGVDPQSRERIWDMLTELQKRGASLLLTTHQLDEAQQICERIAILDHGATVATGTFAELVEQTLGPGRKVCFTLRESVSDLAGFDREGNGQGDGARWSRTVADIATELPTCLNDLASAGRAVIDIEVVTPSLQAVFLNLTGRELRE